MAEDDRLIIEAKFTKADAAVARWTEILEAQALEAQKAGDEAKATILRARSAALTGPQTRSSPQAIAEATAALEKQATVAARRNKIELENLATLEAETKQQAEQLVLTERLQKRPSLVLAPSRRGYSSYEQLASQSVTGRLTPGLESAVILQPRPSRPFGPQEKPIGSYGAPARGGGPYGSTAGQQLAAHDAMVARARGSAAAWALVAQRERESLAAARELEQVQSALVRGSAAFQAEVAKSSATLARQITLERELGGAQAEVARMAAAEGAGRQRARAIEVEQLVTERQRVVANAALQAEMARIRASPAQAQTEGMAANAAYQAGFSTARDTGRRVPLTGADGREALMARPPDARLWEAANREMQRYNIALGEFDGFARRGGLSSQALTANLTRLGLAEAEASNAMRRHGALTTEYLSALARGETTISELGYQVSATIGKFAGWTVAAAAVGTAMGAVYEFGKGAIEAAAGAQQLTRTIEDLDKQKASTALQNLSAQVNVPIKEAADAVFLFSRTFHNLDDAVTAAGLALATFKLDGVAVADSVKAQTAISQQFHLSAQQLVPIYDELAQGQQKFNARVTEQIPALLKSAAAVKIAGGDLRAFIELSTIALRTTNLSGSQIGTAFSRSAANFLNPTTTQGHTNRAMLKSLGLDTSLGYTDLIFQAISKAPSLTPNQISQMSHAIFGNLRGGLMTGLFTGGPGLVGPVGKELSPEGSKGVLQTELSKELHTITQEIHSFVNALQRVGAALGGVGALTPFGLALRAVVGALDGVRALLDEFDKLPHVAKQVVTGLVEARVAMLLLSRTSIGGSIADKIGLSRIGLGPSDETRLRQTLGKGTFNALKATEDANAKTRSQLLINGEQQAVLAKRQLAVEAEIAQAGRGTAVQYEESNAISAKIVSLKRQATELEAESVAQLAVQKDLEAQYVGITKKRGPKRWSYERAQEADMGASAAATEGAAGSVGGAAGATAGLSTATTAERVALEEKIAADAELTAAEAATAAAAEASVVSTDAVVVSTGVLAVATRAAGGAALGMARGIGGLVAAMDPFILALIGLPIAFELLSSANHGMDDAMKKAAATAAKPVTTLKELAVHAKALHDEEQHARDEINKLKNEKSPLDSALGTTRDMLGLLGGSTTLGRNVRRSPPALPPAIYGDAEWKKTLAGLKNPLATLTSGKQPLPAEVSAGYVKFYDNLDAQAKADAKSASGTKAGRERYYAQLAALKTLAAQYAQAHPEDKDAKQYLSAINTALQQDYNAFQAHFGLGKSPRDLFSQFEQMSTADIRKRVTGLGDLSSAGIGGADSLKQASAAVAFLGNRINKGSSSADLQAFGSAMQSFQSDLHKLIGDFVHAAASAPTAAAQADDLAKARTAGQQEIQNIHTELELSIQKYKGNKSAIAKAIALANYRLGLVADEMNTVQQADDARIQAATALTASKNTRIGPEGDIERASTVLAGLRREYAQAVADNASWATLSGLLKQIGDASFALTQQKIAAGQALIEANNAVKSASIGGTGPGADAARAQQDVSNALRVYNYVKKNDPKDPTAIANAYASLLNAQNSLNNTVVSNAQSASQDAAALVQAQGSLAEAQTTDPVKQAEIELQTAIRVLATIKPSDYKTYSEYQAAYLQQQATIAKDRHSVEQQIVDTRMQDLQFQLHTQRITDQQYINGLQQLLKMAQLTKQQRQQIQTAIFDAMHQATVSIGSDNIQMPTEYEVRRGIRAGLSARDRQWTNLINGTAQGGDRITNNRVNMSIVVHRDADLAKFAAVLDNALRGNFTGSAQAMGLI